MGGLSSGDHGNEGTIKDIHSLNDQSLLAFLLFPTVSLGIYFKAACGSAATN
jgi:hypothetical protein